MFSRLQILAGLFLALALCPSPCPAYQNDIPENLRSVLLYAPDPDYPNSIARYGIRGSGLFRITINEKTGTVSEVKVLKSTGHVILNELAAKAFLQWRFKPGTKGHMDVPMTFDVSGFGRTLH